MRIFLAALLLSSCQSASNQSAPPVAPQRPVWVSKTLSGGAQCDAPASAPALVEVEKSLAGVAARDRKMEHREVCEACGCPSYSVDYRFLLDASAVATAEELGFAGVVEGDADCSQWMRTCSCAFECTPRWAVNPEATTKCPNVDCTQVAPAPARCVARQGKCVFETVDVPGP